MLGFFTVIFISSASIPAFAADQKSEVPPVATVETTQTLDTRINNLQSTKDCIHNAKTKAEVDGCRSAIQIKRERINVH